MIIYVKFNCAASEFFQQKRKKFQKKQKQGQVLCGVLFLFLRNFAMFYKRQIKIYLFLFFKISPALLVLNKTIKGQTKISKAEKTCKTEMSFNFKSTQNVRNA